MSHPVVFRPLQARFLTIPQAPLCYWLRERFFDLLAGRTLGEVADVRQGLATASDPRFVRFTWEVPAGEWGRPMRGRRWVPFEKGGYGKWFGHHFWAVDWEDSGVRIKATPGPRVQNEQYYFREGWTYSYMARGSLGLRRQADSVFAHKSPGVFGGDATHAIGAVANCRFAGLVARAISATIQLPEGCVVRVPFPNAKVYSLASLQGTCVALKGHLVVLDATERTFTYLPSIGTTLEEASRLATGGAEAVAAVLHTLEGLREREVFAAYGIAGEDLQAVLDETGTPAGWSPLIAGYDAPPELPGELMVEPKLLERLAHEQRCTPSPDALADLKRRLRTLYEAGAGAQVEDETAVGESDENDAEGQEAVASGARIPIPAETFLEELSQKLEVHPISNWTELRPLTLFFGDNSSGKSSLLADLLMLRQSVLNPDRSTPFVFTSDLGVDLGSYEDLVYGHHYDPRRALSVSLRLRLDEPFVGWARPIREILLRLQIGYDKPRKVTYLLATGIFDKDARRLLEVARHYIRRGPRSEWRLTSDIFSPNQLPAANEITWEHFLPLPAAGSGAHASVSELCQQVAQQVETDFRGITYIGPLRTEPERVYYFTGESVAEVGRRGENTFKLLAAVQYQGKQDELDRRLNWRLKRLGYRLDVRVFRNSPLLQIGVRDEDGQTEGQVYNLKDVGFGLSQVLPVLVQCYTGGTGRTILLEQPELHLHPRAQADLGDLLIDALGQGHRFLIETHSEHLLLRLRRRIAETTVKSSSEVEPKLQRDQVGVYFVERQDNRSLVSAVEVSELGQTPDPPQGIRQVLLRRLRRSNGDQ